MIASAHLDKGNALAAVTSPRITERLASILLRIGTVVSRFANTTRAQDGRKVGERETLSALNRKLTRTGDKKNRKWKREYGACAAWERKITTPKKTYKQGNQLHPKQPAHAERLHTETKMVWKCIRIIELVKKNIPSKSSPSSPPSSSISSVTETKSTGQSANKCQVHNCKAKLERR